MRHVKILTKRGLTQKNHRGKHNVFAYCSGDSVDVCITIDEVHCQAVSEDRCDIDIENGACMFNSTDICWSRDEQPCAYNTYDECNIDEGTPCVGSWPNWADYCYDPFGNNNDSA